MSAGSAGGDGASGGGGEDGSVPVAKGPASEQPADQESQKTTSQQGRGGKSKRKQDADKSLQPRVRQRKKAVTPQTVNPSPAAGESTAGQSGEEPAATQKSAGAEVAPGMSVGGGSDLARARFSLRFHAIMAMWCTHAPLLYSTIYVRFNVAYGAPAPREGVQPEEGGTLQGWGYIRMLP